MHASSTSDNVALLPNPFGPYRILNRLGQGGMGTVYLALDTRLDRQVALKVCNLGDNPQALERFKREARAVASLRHPNLCMVHECDVVAGIPYFTMAFIEGPTLDQWVEQRGGVTQREAAVKIAKAALGLDAAHQRGVIHRDLKPTNIIMEQGEPIVLDFGLAHCGDSGPRKVTRVGDVMGTPQYMAPEQVRGAAVAPATDLYGLGVILYELLTGRLPFEGPVASVLAGVMLQAPPPPRSLRPTIDTALEAICLRCLEKRMEARWPSMGVLARTLTEWALAHPTAAPSVRPPTADPLTPTDPALPPTLQTRVALSAAPPAVPAIVTPPPLPTARNSIGMQLALIPAGTFLMGSPLLERGHNFDEQLHQVTLTAPFWMSVHPVTRGQFRQFVAADRYMTVAEGQCDAQTWAKVQFAQTDDHPVVCVSWKDATAFCDWLTRKERVEYRLPTEAEWEYACRAATTTRYSTGDDDASLQPAAHVGGSATEPVGKRSPNRWSLCGLHGNVWEWCRDRYGDYPAVNVIDPIGPAGGDDRVFRGGGWCDQPADCRSANRLRDEPSARYNYLGFRVVRVAAADGAAG